jgi:hypothetical protein
MRRFVLTLLILLTVFRGAVGDAMAMDMGLGSGKAVATENIAAHAANTPADSGFDSDGQAATVSGLPPCHQNADSAGEDGATPSQAQCLICQVCHSSACTPMVLAVALAPFAQEPPHNGLRTWRSADLSASFKPPVS